MTKRRPPKPWGSRAARSTAGSRSTGSFSIGGPEMAPNPPSLVAPRQSRGTLLDIRDAPLARPWVLLDLAVLVVPKRVTGCVPPGHVQGFNQPELSMFPDTSP